MSVHARQLPDNSRRALDTLVDPNARHERSSSPEASPAPRDQETFTASGDAPRRRSAVDADPATDVAGDLPWYRRERWLAVQIAALVPILGAMLVPATYRLPLCVLGGALVAIGTVMLLRHKPTQATAGSGRAERQ
ncbi:MAG: hypothetical protein ACJ79A_19210 [Gemmatimonadaceae bacterium]